MSIKNRAAAVACGLALAATVFAPVTAFAADNTTAVNSDNTGSTDVTVISQKSDEGGLTGEDQLAFEVPTKIAFAAKADGTLVGPSASATQIVNKSVFGIHVTNIAVTAADGWNYVADASTATQDNAISFTLNNVNAAVKGDVSSETAWNMAYAGSQDASDSIAVATTGKVARVTNDLKTEQKAATITWTLAAGNAQ